jgi:hypothetical protein
MVAEIAALLPEHPRRAAMAEVAGLAVDGAIIRAQMNAREAALALDSLQTIWAFSANY